MARCGEPAAGRIGEQRARLQRLPVKVEIGVVGDNPPPRQRLPLQGEFQAGAMTIEAVLESEIGNPQAVAMPGQHLQSVVLVPEGHQIQGKIFAGLIAPPQLQGEQIFRLVLVVAIGMEFQRTAAVQPGEDAEYHVASAFHPRWAAHRPRERAPESGLFAGQPQQAGAGLHLQTGVIVVLEFGAQYQPPLLGQAQLVLDESAVELSDAVVGAHRGHEGVVVVVLDTTPPQAPDQVVSLPGRKTMLKIDIEGADALSSEGFAPSVVVVVELQVDGAPVGQRLAPAAEQVPARCFHPVGVEADRIVGRIGRAGRIIGVDPVIGGLEFGVAIEIALHGPVGVGGGLAIHPEAAAHPPPLVSGRAPGLGQPVFRLIGGA